MTDDFVPTGEFISSKAIKIGRQQRRGKTRED
jgi:hypothetical protein